MLKRPKFVLAITWKVLVRQLCAPQQNCVIFDDLSDDIHHVFVASVVFELLIFCKKGCNPDPVNSWTVKILWVYLLYGSWFYNFMKISVKNDNRSWVIIANVLNHEQWWQLPFSVNMIVSFFFKWMNLTLANVTR